MALIMLYILTAGRLSRLNCEFSTIKYHVLNCLIARVGYTGLQLCDSHIHVHTTNTFKNELTMFLKINLLQIEFIW